MCASDTITVTFPYTPEFDQTINVQPDGFASLTGAADIHLEGLTTEEASAVIRAAYSRVLHDPVVTVELKDFNKPYFTVSGQVNKPGKYDLRGNTTATEAIAVAGGFNDSAKHSEVLLFRRVNDDWFEVKPMNLKRILHGRNMSEDAEIHPAICYSCRRILYPRSRNLFRLAVWAPTTSSTDETKSNRGNNCRWTN